MLSKSFTLGSGTAQVIIRKHRSRGTVHIFAASFPGLRWMIHISIQILNSS